MESVFFRTAWSERHKQITKKWRMLSNEKKAPYLTQARDNRAALRMKKTQQVTVRIHEYTHKYAYNIYHKGNQEMRALAIALVFVNWSNLEAL